MDDWFSRGVVKPVSELTTQRNEDGRIHQPVTIFLSEWLRGLPRAPHKVAVKTPPCWIAKVSGAMEGKSRLPQQWPVGKKLA